MRYLLLLSMLFSFPALADEWQKMEVISLGDAQESNLYWTRDSLAVDRMKKRFHVQWLIDPIEWEGKVISAVAYMQYECKEGKPYRQRQHWMTLYKGRMGAGEALPAAQGNPWIFDIDDYQAVRDYCSNFKDQPNYEP